LQISASSKKTFSIVARGCAEHVKQLTSNGYACYFSTHTFNHNKAQQERTYRHSKVMSNLPPSRIWGDFGRFYMRICSQIIGNNWNRKRWLQPVVYAFIDVSGTRRNRPSIIKSVVPGIHAVWCVPPRMKSKFQDLLSADPERLANIERLADRTLNFHRNTVFHEVTSRSDYVSSYCVKMLRWELDDVADDHYWTVFPRAKSESSSGYASIRTDSASSPAALGPAVSLRRASTAMTGQPRHFNGAG
jgi:hypothetical protein